jgi:hypothetical protein
MGDNIKYLEFLSMNDNHIKFKEGDLIINNDNCEWNGEIYYKI